jgi:hypothetical protein
MQKHLWSWILVVGFLLAAGGSLAAAPSGAHYRGKTSQGQSISLRVSSSGKDISVASPGTELSGTGCLPKAGRCAPGSCKAPMGSFPSSARLRPDGTFSATEGGHTDGVGEFTTWSSGFRGRLYHRDKRAKGTLVYTSITTYTEQPPHSFKCSIAVSFHARRP